MTQPSVNVTEQDGAIGVLPPSAGKLYALIGACSSGTADTPATYTRKKDVTAAFGVGPLVDAACHYLEHYGRPVVLVRVADEDVTAGTHPSIEGTYDVPDTSVAGTSSVTIKSTSAPLFDAEVKVVIVTGGTRGTAGITYKFSLDGGRTYSPTQALGTATDMELSGTDIVFSLGVGTLVAGDYWTCSAIGPQPNSDGIENSLAALKNSAANWGLVHIVADVSDMIVTVADAAMAAMASMGKPRAWIGSAIMPTLSNDLTTESESSFRSSMTTLAGGVRVTKHGTICSGAVRFRSSVNGSKKRFPVAYLVGARQASVAEHINIADVNLGPLPGGASLADDNGNPEQHDESINPGLDDLGFCVLRTFEGLTGVYVNRPLLCSPEGSDFQLMPHRLVMNLAHETLRAFFLRRLNAPIQVDATTGYILESTALEIEAGATAALRSALGAAPKASAWQVVVSRTDNLLSTRTMNVTARIVPLAYPETIELDLGFSNPALQAIAA